MDFTSFIGIDISKKKFDIALFIDQTHSKHQCFTNDVKGISKFLNWIKQEKISLDQLLICMEHTGHYIDAITRILHGEGIFTWVVTPLILKQFFPTFNRLKTDKADAFKIACYAFSHQHFAQRFEPEIGDQIKVKNLERLRSQLVKIKTQLKNMAVSNQDLASPCMLTHSVMRTYIDQLEKEIKRIEKEVEKVFTSSPKYHRLFKILMSIPGIGTVSATQILILTRGFDRFSTFKTFASFIGTAPFERSSGKWKGPRRISNMSNKKLKPTLYLGALSHIRKGGIFRQYYSHQTNNKGKHHNSVINAIINEILKIAFVLVDKDEFFDVQKFIHAKGNNAKYLILS